MTETEVFSVFVRDARSIVKDSPVFVAGLRVPRPDHNSKGHVHEQPKCFVQGEDDRELSRTQLAFRDTLAHQAVRTWQIETKAEGTPAKVTGFDYARVVWGGLAATTGSIPRLAQGLDLLALDDEDLLANLRMMEKRSIDLVMVMAIVREIKPARETAGNGERAHPYPRR